MPSGARKRKAAKKKKGAKPNNHPNSSPADSQRGGDAQHQDDRHSDVGEGSSTASQDHPSHHDLLTEGEEEKIGNRANVSNPPPVEGVKTKGGKEHGKVEAGSAVPVEREFKNGGEFNRKNGRFEHDERKSYDGGSSGSSSSSSSSDDESHDIKKSKAVVDSAPVSVKTVSTTTVGEASDAVVDSIPHVVSEKVSLLNQRVVESVFKENGMKKGSAEEEVGVSDSFKDAASNLEDVSVSESFKDAASQLEEATPSVENIAATSDPKTCLVEEIDDRLSLSYNAPIVSYDNGADAEKDSGVTEPLLAPPPRPAQTTSWKGCCGLFELFAGSDR